MLNTDTFPDRSFSALLTTPPPHGVVLALSRHEISCGAYFRAAFDPRSLPCFQYCKCHDAWVFVPPLPEAVLNGTDFQQNVWGAENRYAAVLSYASRH